MASPSPTTSSPSQGPSSTGTTIASEPTAIPSDIACPNTVVIELSTTVVIPNFNAYYAPMQIATFKPTYDTLADGSLLTPPYLQDLSDANLSLLIIGALAAIFIRNIFVSADYLRRGKVKKKSLFYVLFISQILSPIALVPVISSYFTNKVNCTM